MRKHVLLAFEYVLDSLILTLAELKSTLNEILQNKVMPLLHKHE
jgi:hypothetical protein